VKRVRLRAAGIAVAALAALLLAAGGWAAWVSFRESGRRGVVPLPSIGAELLFMDGSSIVRHGPATIAVVRFSSPVELRPFHFKADGTSVEPQHIEAWAAQLGAPMVFNAGQFDEGLDYLGWLKRDGHWLSQRRKSAWKGLLVSGPLTGSYWARILDLDQVPAEVADDYAHVVQSMMLLDADSRLRVRDTDVSACRTVVAEDKRGRILVVVTEGAVTLGDLARWLSSAPLDVIRAMNLDGGFESQLAIDTPELKLALYGQYGTGAAVFGSGAGQVRYPLPAVVAVRPRR
jgi:hypothetical protein